MKNAILLILIALSVNCKAQPKHQTITIDDNDKRITYSDDNWRTDADTNCIGSTQHFTDRTGATVSFSFKGDYIIVYYYRQIGFGLFSVVIDDKYIGDVDCGTDSVKPQFRKSKSFFAKAGQWYGSGLHTIKLIHSGVPADNRKTNSVGSYSVVFDAFGVSKKENY